MKCIDAHQHFWMYNPVNHSWIDDDMAKIRRDFMPQDLKPILDENNVDGCVSIQADETEEETEFLLKLASGNSFIKGVVGWVDLRSEKIYGKLNQLAKYPIIKGFRHILQKEDPEFMLNPDFMKGISALKEFDFTYDLLLYPKHLKAALTLVEQNPEQRFVIDHIAKPNIKMGLIKDWKQDIRLIAKNNNVYCKISGMVTEADYKNWSIAEMNPYIDVIMDSFGIDRVMYGSDWPVSYAAATYSQMKGIVDNYFSRYSTEEQNKFFYSNAIKFYQL